MNLQAPVLQPARPSLRATLIGMVVAVLVGPAATLVAWWVLKHTSLPAFGGSFVTRSLASGTAVLVLGLMGLVCYLNWYTPKYRIRKYQNHPLLYLISYLAPAGLITAVLTIPLAATRLYLDGITVDQGFRTQFLTRLTHSTQLTDMNYADLPSFYPGLWFWLAGRFAALTGMAGWAAFQPFALMSLAAACTLLVPVWHRLIGSLPQAAVIALVNCAVMLNLAAEEPYAAVIALGAPAAAVMTWHAARGDKAATLGMLIYLGLSASMYTLYTGVSAINTVVICLISAIMLRSLKPLIHLVIIGLGSMLIATPIWAPYLLKIFSGAPKDPTTANHFLPLEGAQIPLPMFSISLIGVLSLVGVIHLIVRNTVAGRSLLWATITAYGWVVASQFATLTGRTLLSFRLELVICLLLTTAGVLGIAFTVKNWQTKPDFPYRGKQLTLVTIVLACAAGIHFVSDLPNENAKAIDLAYTDTDGSGHRADLVAPDAGQYYAEVDAAIQKVRPGYNTVVLTDEKNFLSYHPYYGFQAFTSHYANPLGQFTKRNELIETWASESTATELSPAKLAADAATHGWRGPEVLLVRVNSADAAGNATSYLLDVADDIYPNNPNVRFRGLTFAASAFSDEDWQREEIGPFVVLIAKTN